MKYVVKFCLLFILFVNSSFYNQSEKLVNRKCGTAVQFINSSSTSTIPYCYVEGPNTNNWAEGVNFLPNTSTYLNRTVYGNCEVTVQIPAYKTGRIRLVFNGVQKECLNVNTNNGVVLYALLFVDVSCGNLDIYFEEQSC